MSQDQDQAPAAALPEHQGHTSTSPPANNEKHPPSSLPRSNSNTSTTSQPSSPPAEEKPQSIWHRIYTTIYWMPPNCRWDPSKPPVFSMAHNVMFAFAGAFTVANLYYNHPILNILAEEFNVSYVKVSQIPTLAQAGYATGLLFLCPLGDLLKRRPFVLSLVFFTATLW